MTYQPIGFREIDDAVWAALNAFPASSLLSGASKDVFQGQDALALPPIPKVKQARLLLKRTDWAEINGMNRPGLKEFVLEPATEEEEEERWRTRLAPLWFRISYEVRHITRSFDLDQILAQWVDTVALRHRSYLPVLGFRVIVLREPKTMNLDLVDPGGKRTSSWSNGPSPAIYEKVRFFSLEAPIDLEAPALAPTIRTLVFGLENEPTTLQEE